jgi:ADP-ribosylglycohydrolase
MLGAIAGDIIGSVFEGSGRKDTDFPWFSSRSNYTDDTELTVAVDADQLESGDYASTLRHYGRQYPDR